MHDSQTIQQAVDILVREAAPTRIILFGSHARGEAGPDSDIDLLVVTSEHRLPRREMARLRRALSPLRIRADVLVTDEARLASSWAGFPGSYLYDALREGKVLYAVDRAGRPRLPEKSAAVRSDCPTNALSLTLALSPQAGRGDIRGSASRG